MSKIVKTYQASIGVRGDCLNCPLPLSVDSYWNCLTDCHHCSFRSLNRTWGTDLRPADPNQIYIKLRNGLKNKNPRSSLAYALSLKKTIRFGSRTDPYQEVELKHEISRQILKYLIKLRWSFAIQTRFLGNLIRDEDLLAQAHELKLLTIIPVISPGAEQDQKILERGRTTPISKRLKILEKWIKKGWNIGINGEPFIPGLHTTKQFRLILKRLKDVGIFSYNTYNLHFNDYVAKRMQKIGIDILKIWEMNQDRNWKKIQRQLCQIALQEGVILGCPDFVNTGPQWIEQTNTCCGVNVPNPSTFNTHFWKRKIQKGEPITKILKDTWEGIGDRQMGINIIKGRPCKNYTMRDAGLV